MGLDVPGSFAHFIQLPESPLASCFAQVLQAGPGRDSICADAWGQHPAHGLCSAALEPGTGLTAAMLLQRHGEEGQG